MTLPHGFEALEPFITVWAKASAVERDGLRTTQSAQARQSYYDAMNPLIGHALDRLDAKSLAEHDAAERLLMQLTLTYAHIATAVEVQGPDEAKHATGRSRLPITRATADI